jgi:hypothetical protein
MQQADQHMASVSVSIADDKDKVEKHLNNGTSKVAAAETIPIYEPEAA